MQDQRSPGICYFHSPNPLIWTVLKRFSMSSLKTNGLKVLIENIFQGLLTISGHGSGPFVQSSLPLEVPH